MNSISVSVRWARILPLALPLLLCVLLLSALSVWEPYWQTNDDVGMAMRVEGFGSIAVPSRNLIFSNALWGAFIQCIPSIRGLLGYSLVTYLVLLAVALVACHFLIRRGMGPWAAVVAVFSVFFYPCVFPQFTVVSGLAGMAAVLALLDYRERRGNGELFLCFILALVSYLIRWNEFLFIVAVSIPLWLSLRILRDRAFLLLFLAITAASLAAIAFDRASYSDVSWAKYNAFNAVRVKLTDYGLADYLKTLPLHSSSELSVNDFDLLRNWFFVDDNLTSSRTMEALRQAVPGELSAPRSVGRGIESIRSAWQDPRAFPLALAGLVIGALLGSLRVWLCLFLFYAGLFYTGYIGRPGVFWAYYPALSACLLWMIAQASTLRGTRRWLAYIALCSLAASTFWQTVKQHQQIDGMVQDIRRDVKELGTDVIVTWGGYFPYEYVYSPFDRNLHNAGFRFYSLSSGTYAPTSLAYRLESEKPGWFVQRLLSSQGLDFSGYADRPIPAQGEYLRNYCMQRHQGELELKVVKNLGSIVVVNARCITGNKG